MSHGSGADGGQHERAGAAGDGERMVDAIDTWYECDERDEDWIPPHERDPSEFADPSCIVCGGQGGWCSDVKDGRCVWEECDCVEWPDGDDDA